MDKSMIEIDVRVQELQAWYANLSSKNLNQIDNFYSEDAFFKDPFNEVIGRASIHKVFDHMFRTTDNPRFVFIDTIVQQDQAFLSWRFHFGLNGKQYEVIGASHLQFDGEARVCTHRDYWDPAEELWQKIPVLGLFIRWLRRKFVAH